MWVCIRKEKQKKKGKNFAVASDELKRDKQTMMFVVFTQCFGSVFDWYESGFNLKSEYESESRLIFNFLLLLKY